MPRRAWTTQLLVLVVVLAFGIVLRASLTGPESRSKSPKFSAKTAKSPAATLIADYCFTCHDAATKSGGLVLEGFDPAHAEKQPEVAEKIIAKVRAGMMPPTDADRPDEAALSALVVSLESQLDKAAAIRPNPGSRPFQRLNRAEYTRSVHDLLSLDVDLDAFLPPDTVSHGFDNIADVQSFSPALMEGYMRAARRISLEAMGDVKATPTSTTFKVPRTASQLQHVDGAPIGTRGGLAVVHNFPADGEYIFKIALHSIATGGLFGSTARGEQIDVSINGARVALVEINPRMSESDPNGMNLQTSPVAVAAGPQRVAAAFIQRFAGPVDDLIQPIEHTLADTLIGSSQGITTLPHLRDLAITGPYKVTGLSETPSRKAILSCRPATAKDERPCATKIVSDLARRAYRRPVTGTDLDGLLKFYDLGRKDGDFEAGVRTALQAILTNPSFLFRLEQSPAAVKPGDTYRITDVELASRLSYFLWATAPDAELMRAAGQGVLKTPAGLEKQVRRMLADPRAEALATRFAAQWLRLQDLATMSPDALLYPQFDKTLSEAMARETELFFDSLVREDRDVLELLTANYTFLNERLAAHYGVAGVSGPAFRRVTIADENRRGLLGQGSILTLTSVANRASPVMRGKWVLEVLLGMPPPPPPPNVPDFDATKAVQAGKTLSVRERIEQHRASPACASCHRVMDPIGLSLENFDVTGAWRTRDNGVPIDTETSLYDGARLTGPASLRMALMNHADVFLRNLAANLMTYSLGRRVDFNDMPAIRTIVRSAAAQHNRFSALVLGIVKSPAFQMSRAVETH